MVNDNYNLKNKLIGVAKYGGTTFGNMAEYTAVFALAGAMAYGGWSMQRDSNYELNELKNDRAVIVYDLATSTKKAQDLLEKDVLNPNLDKVKARGEKMSSLEEKAKKAGEWVKFGMNLASTVAPDSKVGKYALKKQEQLEAAKVKVDRYKVLKAEQSELERNWFVGGGLAGLLLFSSVSAGVSMYRRKREDDELIK